MMLNSAAVELFLKYAIPASVYNLPHRCSLYILRYSLVLMRYGFAFSPSVPPPLFLFHGPLYFSFSSCLSTFLYARPAIPLCSLRHVLFLSAEVPVPPFHFVFFMFSSSLICLFPLPIYLSLSLSFSFSLAAGNSAHLLSLFNVVYLVRPPSLLRNFVRSFLLLCNGAFISSYPPVSHSTRARLSLQPASRPTAVHSPVFFYFATCIVAFLSSAFSLPSSRLSLSLLLFSIFFFFFLSYFLPVSLSMYIPISISFSLHHNLRVSVSPRRRHPVSIYVRRRFGL